MTIHNIYKSHILRKLSEKWINGHQGFALLPSIEHYTFHDNFLSREETFISFLPKCCKRSPCNSIKITSSI